MVLKPAASVSGKLVRNANESSVNEIGRSSHWHIGSGILCATDQNILKITEKFQEILAY